ncbi:MAG: glycoside hydrolase family 16 protein [Salibacteraceae bacterium]|nr:glycoside hydrolase family 16 protein [Salibacteraceae bacterium]|tara:strand:- start:2551 stop:3747 length:1197 start_codon:yes stop_codon:yes gene_type:complete
MKEIIFGSILCLAMVGCNTNRAIEAAGQAESLSEKRIVVPFDSSNFESETQNFTTIIQTTGRYKISVFGSKGSGEVWIEDYVENQDQREYNITGSLKIAQNSTASIEGSPLASGEHSMQVHKSINFQVDSLVLELIQNNQDTKDTLVQNTEGEKWELVWSDEFENAGLPDSTKWSYNIGNWGWGNNELQYYTSDKLENAKIEDGNLVITAIKDLKDSTWTSARLTTQGKVAFKYGKIEFRAKVPAVRGTWAAGWLLGDAYRDEISWPYCGEIDVLECVGYEINDTTEKGINHATCHTRAYYFKQNNQIGSEIELDSMHSKFHTYSVEWYPNEIKGFVDGIHYYTYDKNANDQEWPFHQSQNIILNLAIGGGWGGLKGVDQSMISQQYTIDYVRVFEKR